MNGFLFFLLTISLLIAVQIQTGVLGNQTLAMATGTATATTTTDNDSDTDTTKATTKPIIRENKNGAPALSSMSGGTFLFFLANTLIHLFYFS